MRKYQIVMGVCGWKNSGKTTLIRELIPLFLAQNLTVGVIKKTHHQFILDDPNTDSMYHGKAGASTTVLWSEKGWRSHHYQVSSCAASVLPRILEKMDEDILLLEGHKQAELPKIALLADDNNEKQMQNDDLYDYLSWPFLVGVIANIKPSNLPPSISWHTKNDRSGIVQLILEKGLRL